jgi:lipopolysaccharide transport system ATP-binding protein
MYRMYDRPSDRLKQMLFARLGRHYGREFWALRDVSFELGQGETLGIIGRNGSGKSTLLQIIAGTLAPTEGAVTIEGRVAALLELGSGFHPEFTGRENALMTGAVLGFDQQAMERLLEEVAAFADIGGFMDQPVKFYSSGMFVRLAFAVQTAVEPDILIVDEALSVGDIFFQQKCVRRLQHLMDRGTSILLVTHDTHAVARLCRRAILLVDGRVDHVGDPKSALERYTAVTFGSATLAGRRQSGPEEVRPRGHATPLPPIPAEAPRHGEGGYRLTGATILAASDGPGEVFEQGEDVRVVVEVVCTRPGIEPNLGFQIQDRLGNLVFGANTFMLAQPIASPGQGASVRVCFTMPLLVGSGEYTLSVAVGSCDSASAVDPTPAHIYDWVDQVLRFWVIRSRTPWTVGSAFCPIAVTVSSGDDVPNEATRPPAISPADT